MAKTPYYKKKIEKALKKAKELEKINISKGKKTKIIRK